MAEYPGNEDAHEFARLSLLSPPGDYLKSITKAKRTIEAIEQKVETVSRVDPLPVMIFRAVLPLDLCPRMNELLGPKGGLKKVSKGKTVFRRLHEQNRFERFTETLTGRPRVRFIRFSVKKPDHDASWTKVPQDVLVGSGGAHLGLLEDDSSDHIDPHAWWEPGNAAHQFVYLDVSTDEANRPQ